MSGKTTALILSLVVLCGVTIAHAQATNTFPASGNVGIGTTNPVEKLHVAGSSEAPALPNDNEGILRVQETTGGNAMDIGVTYNPGVNAYSWIQAGASGSPTPWSLLLNPVGGNVGIGTTGPVEKLNVSGSSEAPALPNDNEGILRVQETTGGNAMDIGVTYNPGVNAYSWIQAGASGSPTPWSLLLNPVGGNVGIGTTSPSAKLEVDGNIALTSGSGASITFADGSVQSTAYSGVACGGDYAESVDVQGKKTAYEPGDVLVISGTDGSDVEKSSEPYSTMVAGIYSTKPGYVGRRQTTKSRAREVPMAMVGIVPTKVSAENGPIHRGDLLVTSSIPGYAMKGTDRSRMLGAVVGKAMGNLDSGKGVIEVLVTLQ